MTISMSRSPESVAREATDRVGTSEIITAAETQISLRFVPGDPICDALDYLDRHGWERTDSELYKNRGTELFMTFKPRSAADGGER